MNDLPTPLPTEQVPCNLCGEPASRSKRLFVERYRLGGSEAELGIVKCRRCGLVYVSPRLTVEATARVYRDDAEQTISHDYCWEGDRGGQRFRRLLGQLAALKPEGRLLDVGCGTGQFLAAAGCLAKWERVGIEPFGPAAEKARQVAKCQVYAGTLAEAPLAPGSFDIVAILGVLEHVHDPRGVLRRAHGLLRPAGLIAVYVPGFHYLRLKDTGLASWLRRRAWSDLHPQEHLYQFTPRSMASLLEASQFRILSLEIGHPFLRGGPIQRWLKMGAYHAVRALKSISGLHFGGIELVARRVES